MNTADTTPIAASVREIQQEVRVDLTDAPQLEDLTGRLRKPMGLRLSYGLRSDVSRVDIAIEYQDEAQHWPPAAGMPDWLNQLIENFRPRDVDDPQSVRPTGMGGWAIDAATRTKRSVS